MPTKLLPFCCLAAVGINAWADGFQLTNVIPEQTDTGVILNISTTGDAPSPSDLARYENKANWQVMWQAAKSDVPTRPEVTSAHIMPGQKLSLGVQGSLPPGDPRIVTWSVLFLPPPEMAALPAELTSTQRKTAPAKQPFLSSLQPGDAPDVMVSGSFLAGGNTKPIYTIQEQASLFAAEKKILGFAPGVSSALAINQGAQPPNNRTRLDPDSIQGSISFWRVDPIQKGLLYGMTTKVDLVSGEFARSDPSSNITAGFLSTFVLNRKRLSDLSYFSLHPVAGLEAGHNLNAPSSLQGAPVDLSHYAAILRGVTGGDAVFAVAASDKMSNVFSIKGSYRVRLPATDEPFVATHHEQTTADMTTKPRHWIEVDITYSPPQWKYLGLTAKYQYGSLPPIFSFVDQQASLGLLFQAKQTNKPVLPSQ